MDPRHGHIPNLQLQSPAVDFVENSLDKYHPAFSTPPSRYDPYLGGFIVQDSQDMTPAQPPPAIAVAMYNGGSSGSPDAAQTVSAEFTTGTPTTPAETWSITPRPSPQPVNTLDFWDLLFPQAMSQLSEEHPGEPARLLESGHRIRDKTNWAQVYDQLEEAKNKYFEVDSKFKTGFRKVYRGFADNVSEPANRLTKLVPGGGDLGAVAVTPIIGCVQVLLEASRAASKVRATVANAFDQVDNMFADVELFLQLYPRDENIKKASIKLICSTLFATENVLGFFLKGAGKRFLSAAVKRERYEENTIESLSDIKLQCEQLLQEAEKSNKYQMLHTTKAIMDRTGAT